MDKSVVLNPRRHLQTTRARSAKLTPIEQRFYTAAPRFEETMKRVCAKSVVMLRSDIADSLVRGLGDLEHDYEAAYADNVSQDRPTTDLEARFGAAIVLVHLQLFAKVNELEEIAVAATPVADVARLSANLTELCQTLARIEAKASVATTGDLNEEERMKIKLYDASRLVRVAEGVQLRREAQAAAKRFADGQTQGDEGLQSRARDRAKDIHAASSKLRETADLSRELQLDQTLKQIAAALVKIH